MIRPMPGCSEETLTEIEKRIPEISNYAMYLLAGSTEETLQKIFKGMELDVLDTAQPLWKCDCSKKRLEQVVVSLGKHEIKDMIEKDDGAEIVCRFCNKKYRFSSDDLKRLLDYATKE